MHCAQVGRMATSYCIKYRAFGFTNEKSGGRWNEWGTGETRINIIGSFFPFFYLNIYYFILNIK